VCSGSRKSVDLLVLGDQVLLPRRLNDRMSRRGFRSEDILLKKILSDGLQALLKCPTLMVG